MSHSNFRAAILLCYCAAFLSQLFVSKATAQVTANQRADLSAPPSLSNRGAQSEAADPLASIRNGQLPTNGGQESRQYDLTRYTANFGRDSKPEQAIVDWILRETGTDVWFTQPFGYLSASRKSLAVYHVPSMHDIVQKVVDKFVSGPTDPHLIKLRMLTVSNPNWRARALPLIQDVSVESPGVQAWLVTKENAAVLATMLKARSDTKEVQNAEIPIHNGQSEQIAARKGRNHVRSIRQAATAWPPYEPEIGEIKEGYSLEISPLVDVNGETLECVIRANIDQVDKLVPVDLSLPLPNGQTHKTRIEVPQVVSWRLHERFRWPSDMVLLLSCGVVASPDRQPSVIPMLNIDRLVGNTPGRADALLFVELDRPTKQRLTGRPNVATAPDSVSRGRY